MRTTFSRNVVNLYPEEILLGPGLILLSEIVESRRSTKSAENVISVNFMRFVSYVFPYFPPHSYAK